jgi:hypothetical protein
MINPFQATIDHPYHLSIGAILRNETDKICCHYFGPSAAREHKKYNQYENFYLLMRETIEPGESVEQCLHRGLMEEFGARAELKTYVGSIISQYPIDEKIVEKTTAYFLCDLISFDQTKRRENDPEGGSKICWVSAVDLIAKMKEQGKRLKNTAFDESVVVERAMEF